MRTSTFKFLILATTLVLSASCKDENKEPDKIASPVETNSNGSEGEKIAVNPAHGQPGHRCDLPVGAPLNSVKVNQQATSTTKSSSSVSPIRVDQTPKVNPPHGEPYHDCSIPVGAKLEK